ncbi:hypothetical protein CVT25_008391 [Psilocybe cyanescens]|uniref:DDE Tnp4 domain-containing protein n=1 Tax=Psilocybe cyanescens TaxID=93625 RepID=A0A409XVD2_PSICY|nr:hypothetical protein CVT25_008391 [Psilocybe cyanescens]
MPTISECQALINALLLATEEEFQLYFDHLEKDDDFMDDLASDSESSAGSDSQLTSSTSSISSTSSTSSTSLTLSTSSDPPMVTSDQEETSDPERDTHMNNILSHSELLDTILASRLLSDLTPVPKLSQIYLVLVEYRTQKPKQFRRNLQVLPSTFNKLIECIKDHPVFANHSNATQFPVEIQLAIALYRFGHDGNATSVEAVAQWAGVSIGLVVKATQRVMIAFLSLHDSVVCWPSEEEIEEARQWVEMHSCAAWHNGYCMVNGTLIPLFEKLGHHGEAYFDRKSNYSLNVQLITLPNLQIIDYVVGYCGSAHDATVFRVSQTYAHSDKLFKDSEWIWADSAYALDMWCVTPYKKPLSNCPENAKFNYHLSLVRQIDDAKDHERAVAWIKACIVIHTLVFFIEHGHEDKEHIKRLIQEGTDDPSISNPCNDIESEAIQETRGQQKREQLKSELLESLSNEEAMIF